MLGEWGVTPDYIVNNWTDELFNLMIEKLIERKEKESNTISGDEYVSDETLFNSLEGKIIKE